MSLTQEKITTLKKLTALTSGEHLSIESVVDSFNTLETAIIDIGMPATRSGKGMLLPRPDEVHISAVSSTDLLHCSPQKVIAEQISLSSIMHGE